MKAAFGVDLGGSNLRVALISEAGKILASERMATPLSEGPEGTVQTIARLINKLGKEAGERGADILGVGVGSPGPLSRREQKIFQTPNLPGFEGYPMGEQISQLTSYRVMLDNDAKVAAYGEAIFGVATNTKNFIYLTFGTGIGGAVLVNGQMLYGKSDGACELGHITLYPEGLPCGCGNRGCFEQYCSARAFERRATESAGKKCTAPETLQALLKEEEWASDMLKSFCQDLATATASLVNIFDPEIVVFGGGLFSTGGGPICDWVAEEIRGRCFESSQRHLKILPSALRGNAGVLGAASLILK